ncbi:MAG: LLM class flavin-dependent oxidoreductase [Acidimicrobiia bacterium]|nr:LLM class flavin-dependent oxidoreductase [Acidimicrobiia bacterium]
MEFALQASGSYDTLLAAARWSEERGLACFAIPDHYVMAMAEEGIPTPAYDAFVLLAGLARDTSTIRMSVLVSPVTFRHPAVLSKSGFTMDAISGGRFTLGIGTGWHDMEHEIFGFDYPPMAERYEMMEEALAYVRAMAAGDAFDGDRYRLQARELNPRPSAGFGIVVGGRGAVKTPTLAGRYADEFNAYPGPPDEFSARISLARTAAVAAGRDPETLMISSAGTVLVGSDEADYRDRLAELAAEDGISVDDLEAHFEKRQTPRGTSEQVREQLAAMESLGVSRFYLQTMWPNDLVRTGDTLDLMGG